MLYWGLDNDMAVGILVLSAASVYLAYDMTRLAKGAPRGWYVVVAAFGVEFLFRAVQLYFDTQSSTDSIDDAEAAATLVIGVLLVVGLYMLRSSFRKRANVHASQSSDS